MERAAASVDEKWELIFEFNENKFSITRSERTAIVHPISSDPIIFAIAGWEKMCIQRQADALMEAKLLLAPDNHLHFGARWPPFPFSMDALCGWRKIETSLVTGQ